MAVSSSYPSSSASSEFISLEMINDRARLLCQVNELKSDLINFSDKLSRDFDQCRIIAGLKNATSRVIVVVSAIMSDQNCFAEVVAKMRACHSSASFMMTYNITNVASFKMRFQEWMNFQMPIQSTFKELIKTINRYVHKNIARQTELVIDKVNSIKENNSPKFIDQVRREIGILNESIQERDRFLQHCEYVLGIPDMYDATLTQQALSNLEQLNEEVSSFSLN
jgi:hypothetical protein